MHPAADASPVALAIALAGALLALLALHGVGNGALRKDFL